MKRLVFVGCLLASATTHAAVINFERLMPIMSVTEIGVRADDVLYDGFRPSVLAPLVPKLGKEFMELAYVAEGNELFVRVDPCHRVDEDTGECIPTEARSTFGYRLAWDLDVEVDFTADIFTRTDFVGMEFRSDGRIDVTANRDDFVVHNSHHVELLRGLRRDEDLSIGVPITALTVSEATWFDWRLTKFVALVNPLNVGVGNIDWETSEPIPEPATWWISAIGMVVLSGALGGKTRKRRRMWSRNGRKPKSSIGRSGVGKAKPKAAKNYRVITDEN